MFSNESILAVVFCLGAAQGIFLSLALFTSPAGAKPANHYLGILCLLFVAALIDYFLDIVGLTQTYPQLRTILWPKEFFYGPLIYFYTRGLTQASGYWVRGKEFVHLIPAAVHVLVSWSLLLLEAELQYQVFERELAAEQGLVYYWSLLLGDIELGLAIAHVTVYLIISLRILRQHQTRILDQFSNLDRISLVWLRNLLFGILSVYIAWVLDEVFAPDSLQGFFSALLGISIVILIYTMGFLGLRQPAIFGARIPLDTRQEYVSGTQDTFKKSLKKSFRNNIQDAVQDNTQDAYQDSHQDSIKDETVTKYKNSPLSEDMSSALLQELESVMTAQELFLNPQLSLPQLANHLSVSPNYLSQVINQQKQQNFFDYINGYRVKKVQALFEEQQDISILDAGLAAGFNSKTAFYTAFKKHLAQTPGQYRKSKVLSQA